MTRKPTQKAKPHIQIIIIRINRMTKKVFIIILRSNMHKPYTY